MDDDEQFAPVTEDEIGELIEDAANPIVPRDTDNSNEAETNQVETIEQDEGTEAEGTAAENVEATDEPADEPAIDIEPEESSDDKPVDQEQEEVSEPTTGRPSPHNHQAGNLDLPQAWRQVGQLCPKD